jgi:predicted transcriptional regulator
MSASEGASQIGAPYLRLIIVGYWFILVFIALYFRWENEMTELGRVITAKLPDELVSQMDEIAGRIDRSKSWIVREAVSQWLADEQRRYELTLQGLRDVDEGRMIDHEDLKVWADQTKREARKSAA